MDRREKVEIGLKIWGTAVLKIPIGYSNLWPKKSEGLYFDKSTNLIPGSYKIFNDFGTAYVFWIEYGKDLPILFFI